MEYADRNHRARIVPVRLSLPLRRRRLSVFCVFVIVVLSAFASSIRITGAEEIGAAVDDQYAKMRSADALVDIHNSTGYTRSNPRQLTANYTYSISATGSLFVLSVHVVQSFAYVDVADTMIVVEPDKPFTDSMVVDDLGNEVLQIRLQSQTSLGKFSVMILQHFTVYSIRYSVDPSKVGSYDKTSDLYKLYTKSTEYIQSSHPEIVAKSKEIVGGETNPYLAAKKIHSFVVNHMTYDMSAVTPWKPETEGALFALRSGKGVCRHFAALFTALARAAGIPTADIWGSRATGKGYLADAGDYKHNWVHFFMPNYGWIPAEPTMENGWGGDWFAQLRDNGDVPVMSVSYVYDRAWWSGGNAKSAIYEEPAILTGFQVTELPNPTILLLVVLLLVPCVFRKKRY